MEEARALIAAFMEMNRTEKSGAGDRSVGHFTAALVGMIGSTQMFNTLLSEFDTALATGKISVELKARAKNLQRTFVPQVAAMNKISDLSEQKVSAAELRTIRCDSPENREKGVRMILAAMMKILKAINGLS